MITSTVAMLVGTSSEYFVTAAIVSDTVNVQASHLSLPVLYH